MVLDDGIEPPFSVYQTEVIYHYTNRAWYSVLESNQRGWYVTPELIPSANRACCSSLPTVTPLTSYTGLAGVAFLLKMEQ